MRTTRCLSLAARILYTSVCLLAFKENELMTQEKKQTELFEIEKDWESEWQDMPEFKQEDLRPWHQVNVRFRNQKDFDEFKKRMEQEVTPKQKTLWFPFAPYRRASHLRYVDEDES